MKKIIFFVLLSGLIFAGCTQQDKQDAKISYDVAFPDATHNEAEITLTAKNLPASSFHVRMSRSSPGRYALHEFAKNVYSVHAVNGAGDTLEIDHPDLHNWEINNHDGTVKFSYTLYGDHADGTYSGINREHAHLNMPATFAWASNYADQPISVHFEPPAGSNWKIATQLKPEDEANTFFAPDFSYFMDSPTELSNFSMNTWTVKHDTTTYTYRLAMHHNGTQSELDNYTDMAKKIVDEETAVYGEPASYDYGTYTFIVDYLPYVYGDGMEHRNSTIITSKHPLKEGAKQNISTLAHEFFHSWNVERIRPEGIKPFDFTQANVSGALWFAEGFTNYYGKLAMRRAGITSASDFANNIGGTLDFVFNALGSEYYNAVEMSRQAPFVDAATSIDQQNKSNTFITYYWWGETLGLSLDLRLRTTFDGLTLDDYMRAMWKKYGVTEKAYSVDDLQETLAEVTDSAKFAENFFDKYVYGHQFVDLKTLLARAGFALQKQHPGKVVLTFGDAKIDFKDGNATITENTIVGSPLYKAGLDREDTILEINHQKISNARVLNRLLAQHNAGESLSITYHSLGKEYDTTVVLAEDPSLQLQPFEQAGMELTNQMRSFRKQWLGSHVQK